MAVTGTDSGGDSARALAGSDLVANRYAGTTASLQAARTAVDSWLVRLGAPQRTRENTALVVGELCANAVEASNQHYEVSHRLVENDSIELTVVNRTTGSSIPPRHTWRPAELLAPRGRGLGIIAALVRSVQVDQSVAGVVRVVAQLSFDPER